MGRRAKGHTYVKYILLLDKNGQIGQRHELDSHGRLKYPLDSIPQINRKQTTDQSQTEQIDTRVNDIYRIPMPPMLRTKMQISSLFNFNWNFNESKILDQTMDMPNVVDARPKKLLEVQLS